MAASTAVPGLNPTRAAIAPAEVPPVSQSPVVRTEVHVMPAGAGARSGRRRIPPPAGIALEILGHAIEYLADEYVHQVGRLPVLGAGSTRLDPQIEAMQILMAANRQVYFECPVVAPLYQRLLRRFRRGQVFRRIAAETGSVE